MLSLNCCFASFGQNKNYKIIVNAGLPYENIERTVIQKIFLGKRTTWDNGSPAIPVTLNSRDVHAAFLNDIVKKSPDAFNSLWMSLLYTGRATPPPSFASDTELLMYVAETPGAVGYIESTTSLENVTGIRVITVKD